MENRQWKVSRGTDVLASKACALCGRSPEGGHYKFEREAESREMAGTMKVLRKMQAAEGLQMDTIAVPLIGPADVRVRVKTASICGTDLHIYGWEPWWQGRIQPASRLGQRD